MNRSIKIIVSVVFVCVVAFFVVRGCVEKKHPAHVKSRVVSKKAVKPIAVPKKTKVVPAKTTAKMAIILDDWGVSTTHVAQVVALKRPITLAIIPHLAHSRDVAESAKAHGLGVMLHMPMQPKNLRQPKERYTITTQSSDEEIKNLLLEALATVPHVEGINNHQGSAATSDERVMKAVISYLKIRKLFFVDSNVIATTVGWKIARDSGLPYTKRDVFIDNEAKVESIKSQLKKAEEKALNNGSVVVIGHDKKATLDAIQAMIPDIEEKGIELVLVKELLQ